MGPALGICPARHTTIPETPAVKASSTDPIYQDNIRLWVWYWIDSEEVRRWRRQHGAVDDNARVFGCALASGASGLGVRRPVSGGGCAAVAGDGEGDGGEENAADPGECLGD